MDNNFGFPDFGTLYALNFKTNILVNVFEFIISNNAAHVDLSCSLVCHLVPRSIIKTHQRGA